MVYFLKVLLLDAGELHYLTFWTFCPVWPLLPSLPHFLTFYCIF